MICSVDPTVDEQKGFFRAELGSDFCFALTCAFNPPTLELPLEVARFKGI